MPVLAGKIASSIRFLSVFIRVHLWWSCRVFKGLKWTCVKMALIAGWH